MWHEIAKSASNGLKPYTNIVLTYINRIQNEKYGFGDFCTPCKHF